MNGRRLIHIPIIHTEVDMGSLAKSLKKKYIQRYGVHKWRHHLKKIDELWTNKTCKLIHKFLYLLNK